MFKNFRIREPMQVQFRAELYNSLNQVLLGNPTTLMTSPLFGRITTAESARVVQFGLKLNW